MSIAKVRLVSPQDVAGVEDLFLDVLQFFSLKDRIGRLVFVCKGWMQVIWNGHTILWTQVDLTGFSLPQAAALDKHWFLRGIPAALRHFVPGTSLQMFRPFSDTVMDTEGKLAHRPLLPGSRRTPIRIQMVHDSLMDMQWPLQSTLSTTIRLDWSHNIQVGKCPVHITMERDRDRFLIRWPFFVPEKQWRCIWCWQLAGFKVCSECLQPHKLQQRDAFGTRFVAPRCSACASLKNEACAECQAVYVHDRTPLYACDGCQRRMCPWCIYATISDGDKGKSYCKTCSGSAIVQRLSTLEYKSADSPPRITLHSCGLPYIHYRGMPRS